MSNELYRILRAWVDWVDEGAPVSEWMTGGINNRGKFEGLTMRRDVGLCWHVKENAQTTPDKVCDELKAMFIAEGLDEAYPFHPCYAVYDQEAEFNESWSNADRYRWARLQVTEYEREK